jgi:heme A synthase
MAVLLFVGAAYVFFVVALGVSKAMFATLHADMAQNTAPQPDEADEGGFEKP